MAMPRYAAPEHFSASGSMTSFERRAYDIYSLGITLTEVLDEMNSVSQTNYNTFYSGELQESNEKVISALLYFRNQLSAPDFLDRQLLDLAVSAILETLRFDWRDRSEAIKVFCALGSLLYLSTVRKDLAQILLPEYDFKKVAESIQRHLEFKQEFARGDTDSFWKALEDPDAIDHKFFLNEDTESVNKESKFLKEKVQSQPEKIQPEKIQPEKIQPEEIQPKEIQPKEIQPKEIQQEENDDLEKEPDPLQVQAQEHLKEIIENDLETIPEEPLEDEPIKNGEAEHQPSRKAEKEVAREDESDKSTIDTKLETATSNENSPLRDFKKGQIFDWKNLEAPNDEDQFSRQPNELIQKDPDTSKPFKQDKGEDPPVQNQPNQEKKLDGFGDSEPPAKPSSPGSEGERANENQSEVEAKEKDEGKHQEAKESENIWEDAGSIEGKEANAQGASLQKASLQEAPLKALRKEPEPEPENPDASALQPSPKPRKKDISMDIEGDEDQMSLEEPDARYLRS